MKEDKNIYFKFEKEMADLKAVLNKNVESNKDIKELIDWFRLEFSKIPEKYPGDYVVIYEIRRNVAQGLTLSFSLHAAYSTLKSKFAIYNYS